MSIIKNTSETNADKDVDREYRFYTVGYTVNFYKNVSQYGSVSQNTRK